MTQPKTALNKRVILVSRPVGIAQANDFAIEEAALPLLQDGEVCVANRFLSVDPAMRGWIADSENYSDPVPIGGVMRSLAIGKIVESRSPD
jgi:NADPH-dependent curcumin reductase CurA